MLPYAARAVSAFGGDSEESRSPSASEVGVSRRAPGPARTRRADGADRLPGRVEDLGALALRWIPVDVYEQVIAAVVRGLERSSRIDVDQAAGGDVLTLRRIPDVHRQRPGENDERLLLGRVPVASPSRARFIAPDIRPSVRELRALAQLGDVSSGLPGPMRAGDPLEAVGVRSAEADDVTVIEAAALEPSPGRARAPPAPPGAAA